MDISENKTRRFIEAGADIVIRRLPSLGSLMIIGKANGATHERIGVVEKVEPAGACLAATGDHHNSRMDPSLVARIVLDTSSVMQGQVYPRLDFQDEDGGTVFAFVGFGGLEPFEAGLADLSQSQPTEAVPVPRPQRPDVAETDPGAVPLKAALQSATPVTIAFESRGFSQSWAGTIKRVSPGMGFINIMTPDFHLHLLGGTMSAWREEDVASGTVLTALDHDGNPTGLVLSSEIAGAFSDTSMPA